MQQISSLTSKSVIEVSSNAFYRINYKYFSINGSISSSSNNKKSSCSRVVKYAHVHISIINRCSFRKRQTVASVCAALLNANGINVLVKDCLSSHGTCLYCCNKCILNLSVICLFVIVDILLLYCVCRIYARKIADLYRQRYSDYLNYRILIYMYFVLIYAFLTDSLKKLLRKHSRVEFALYSHQH